MREKFTMRIYRGVPSKQYWEEFELPLLESANVISCLMEIRENPINIKGERVAPVVWEDGCLEEVCGSCSVLVNGKPRQACTALIGPILEETGKDTITLAPFTSFPLVRDLMVDRTAMFENLKKVQAWVEVDGSYELGSGPKISQDKQEIMYVLSTCMTCGCCSEACPMVNPKSEFVGPAAISQVRLFNGHPTGADQKADRLHPLMEEGGISSCGNSQNCVQACPKEIPLTASIGVVGRQVRGQWIRDLFSFSDE